MRLETQFRPALTNGGPVLLPILVITVDPAEPEKEAVWA